MRAWIAANADKISEIAPITASISPEAAVAVTRKGGRLNLAGHNSADWRLQATALWRVGAVERDLAIAVIEADKARISDTNRDLVVESEHSACRPLAAFPPRRHPSWNTSSYDAAHLFVAHVRNNPSSGFPIPTTSTQFEVVTDGRIHRVPGARLKKWIEHRRSEWKGPRGLLFSQRPLIGD